MNTGGSPISSGSCRLCFHSRIVSVVQFYLLLAAVNCFRFQTEFHPLYSCEQNFVQDSNLTETLTGTSVLTCARHCTRTHGCSGFNFCQETGSSTCELLGYVVGTPLSKCADLVYRTGCIYYQRKVCFNGGRYDVDQDSCACAAGFKGPACKEHWTDCIEGFAQIGGDVNNFVTVLPRLDGPTLTVHCKNARTIIARKNRGGTSFFTDRGWNDYRNGFFKFAGGSISSNFWIGLEGMHELTATRNYTLLVEFKVYDDLNVTGLAAKYENFRIENEAQNYTLRYSQYELWGNNFGWAGDGLGGTTANDTSRDQPFCTLDRDCGECATNSNSAWWFNTGCSYVNPLGLLDDFMWPVNGTKVPLQYWLMALV